MHSDPSDPLAEYLAIQRARAAKTVEPTAPPTAAPAGRRIFALIVDRIVLHVVALELVGPLMVRFGWRGITYGPVVAEVAYAAIFYPCLGATPGKMMFGLRVVDAAGAHLDPVRAILRDTLGKLLSTLILSGGFLMAFARRDRRALHDLLVGSRVVRTRSETPAIR